MVRRLILDEMWKEYSPIIIPHLSRDPILRGIGMGGEGYRCEI